MTPRLVLALVASAALLAPTAARAQDAALPRSAADAMLDAGRWSDAEEMLYASVRSRPRDPVARARLGRYLAMKGALRPGLVLIEEAEEFGLPPATARALASPIRSLMSWREREAASARDSAIAVRPPSASDGLFRVPMVRVAGDTTWAEVVPRAVGLDSAGAAGPRIGIETLERYVPSFDAADHLLQLHADPRAALGAVGRRYPVLRTADGVRVLLAPGRVRPLADALRELTPRWWQLDLAHGFIVVR